MDDFANGERESVVIEKFKQSTKKVPFFYSSYHTFRLLARAGVKRYPFYDEKTKLSCNPFFIIGSGRSGNTLLRAILWKNEEVVIPPRIVRSW